MASYIIYKVYGNGEMEPFDTFSNPGLKSVREVSTNYMQKHPGKIDPSKVDRYRIAMRRKISGEWVENALCQFDPS